MKKSIHLLSLLLTNIYGCDLENGGAQNKQNEDSNKQTFPMFFPVSDSGLSLSGSFEATQIAVSSFAKANTLISVKNVSGSTKCNIKIEFNFIDKNGSPFATHSGKVLAILKADESREYQGCLLPNEVGYMLSFSMIDLSRLASISINSAKFAELDKDILHALRFEDIEFANDKYSMRAVNESLATIGAIGGLAINFSKDGLFLWWSYTRVSERSIAPNESSEFSWKHTEDELVDLKKTVIVF